LQTRVYFLNPAVGDGDERLGLPSSGVAGAKDAVSGREPVAMQRGRFQ